MTLSCYECSMSVLSATSLLIVKISLMSRSCTSERPLIRAKVCTSSFVTLQKFTNRSFDASIEKRARSSGSCVVIPTGHLPVLQIRYCWHPIAISDVDGDDPHWLGRGAECNRRGDPGLAGISRRIRLAPCDEVEDAGTGAAFRHRTPALDGGSIPWPIGWVVAGVGPGDARRVAPGKPLEPPTSHAPFARGL